MTKETYLRSIDVLLDAYNQGTLFHGNCNHCAVGNLLDCDLWSVKFMTNDIGIQTEGHITSSWDVLMREMLPSDYEGLTSKQKKFINKHVKSLFEERGFTEKELRKIEFAFETSIRSDYDYYFEINPKQGQYLGLCAVLKVMSEMVEEPIDSELSLNKLNTIAQKFNAV